MLGRIKNSWLLMKCSLNVMMLNKKLLLFPAVIMVLSIFIGLFFLAPVALQPTGYSYTQVEHWKALKTMLIKPSAVNTSARGQRDNVKLTNKGWAYFSVFYLILMFTGAFFNVAFFSEIVRALKGEEVSIARGFKFAGTKIKPILFWSLFSGAVGLVIRFIEEKVGFIGRIIVGFIGIGWSIASVFVIPEIIRQEEENPLKLLQGSAIAVKRTWGESLAGFVGLQSVVMLAILAPLICLIGIVYVSIALHATWIIILAIIAYAITVFVVSYLAGVAGNIYKCALYLFAFEGFIPAPYTQEMMYMGWKTKKVKQ
jgi:hypothetical protein